MLLCAGLRLLGRSVLVGYASHQFLALACANVDALASGSWLNVRSFSLQKFTEEDPDSVSRRAKWFYCPDSLSEYKVAFLDMGYRARRMDLLRPGTDCPSQHCDVLFQGAQPSVADYGERDAFAHYLECLRTQCRAAHRRTFQETSDKHSRMLDSADRRISELHSLGIRGQDRDFAPILDVNRAALTAFASSRGFVMERQWT
jgi:hypothetical protein